ncbi:lysoplasmalogenase [Candidatus Uabimicrobium sp. HlEnr_7]|uniref:lysoplasmalogenase n=1 Tax=Candidatus Uabimicrobium helgolandensis TaxID=3095367 RepID=UPI0035577A78
MRLKNRAQSSFFTLAILTSILHLIVIVYDFRNGIYITKPLVLVLLIQVWNYEKDSTANYGVKHWFVLGLLFSLVGDIVLMTPKMFVYGILFFLGAQCSYIIAFLQLSFWKRKDLLYLVPAVIYMLILLSFLLPHVGTILLPIIIYAFIISLMLWRALCLLTIKSTHSYLLVVGSVLFVLSDSCIAINKFVTEIPQARFIIMSTYFAAQILLCYSTICLTRIHKR